MKPNITEKLCLLIRGSWTIRVIKECVRRVRLILSGIYRDQCRNSQDSFQMKGMT